MSNTIRVVVTGATGQVAYALLPRIASGEMFGPDVEIDLRLSDIPQMIDKAKGVLMELEDGAYPLLERVIASADRGETHHRADWVLLVGSVPRGPGMERGDLIRKNGPIFVEEGKAADQVVDRKWLETDYIPQVQQRGAAVIAARGASSAFSAAQALVDHVRSLVTPTPKGDCFSAAVVSDGSYGVPKGLVSSFPLHSKGDGAFGIVPNVPLDDFAKGKIAATIAELEKERDLVKDLLAP